MSVERWARYSRHALLIYFAVLSLAADARQPRPQNSAFGIPFVAANVASSDGHAFVVSWDAPSVRQVRIFAGTDPKNVSRDHLVGKGEGMGQISVHNLPPAPRWYFQLVPDRGEPLVIADRSLHLTTAANLRDTGGYRTMDGEWVRMGLAYRSNGLEHLTDDELEQIDRLNIHVVCDLRTAEEIRRGPDRVPQGVGQISADVLADDADLIHSMLSSEAAQATNPQNGGAPSREGMEERIYRDFVRLPSARRAYALLFERLADPAALPTIFHCTAGKDRTGWAVAVFLTMLGVPRSTIMEDYLLTNVYLRGQALKSVRQSMNQRSPAKVQANAAALDSAFDEVLKDYGSFDNYLSQGLHLSNSTLAAIRRNFVAG